MLKNISLIVRLNIDQHEFIRKQAHLKDISMAEEVRQCIDIQIKKLKKK